MERTREVKLHPSLVADGSGCGARGPMAPERSRRRERGGSMRVLNATYAPPRSRHEPQQRRAFSASPPRPRRPASEPPRCAAHRSGASPTHGPHAENACRIRRVRRGRRAAATRRHNPDDRRSTPDASNVSATWLCIRCGRFCVVGRCGRDAGRITNDRARSPPSQARPGSGNCGHRETPRHGHPRLAPSDSVETAVAHRGDGGLSSIISIHTASAGLRRLGDVLPRDDRFRSPPTRGMRPTPARQSSASTSGGRLPASAARPSSAGRRRIRSACRRSPRCGGRG